MKKVLLGSSALLLSAGFAWADVSVGGDGRMGIISGFDDPLTAQDEDSIGFTSRIRISFSASGETDAGLAFGGSVRVDNYENDQATNGTEGSVFVEGTFGKISMGDVSGAAEAAVGDVSGVGLTGLGDFNETIYLLNGDRPAALYEYSTGDLTVYASAENPGESAIGGAAGDDGYGVGASYGFGNFTLAAGWETIDVASVSTDHWVIGASAAFGDATVKAIYGDSSDLNLEQTGVSLDYVFGATTATIFYRNVEVASVDVDGFGVGVSYDLGGGASLKAGYVDIDDGVANNDDDAFDFGISMSF